MSENRFLNGFEYKPVSEIKENGKLLGKVGYKPMSAVIVLCIAAILFLFIGHLFGILMAVLCAAGAGYIYFGLKDRQVMDVYDDALIFHHPEDASLGIRFKPDQIKQWTVNKDGSYQIALTLKDQNIYVMSTYQISNANRMLKKLMPKKNGTNPLAKRLKK